MKVITRVRNGESVAVYNPRRVALIEAKEGDRMVFAVRSYSEHCADSGWELTRTSSPIRRVVLLPEFELELYFTDNNMYVVAEEQF